MVGSKALKYKFGDDTWVNPAQTMQKVVITRDQLAAAGMPPAILELVPEEIKYVTEPGTALDIGSEEQPYDDFFGIAQDEDLSGTGDLTYMRARQLPHAHAHVTRFTNGTEMCVNLEVRI